MERTEIIRKTEEYIRLEFSAEGSGHDWFHVDRVRKMALQLAKIEGCDLFITEMAALLHDLDDWKLTADHSGRLPKATRWLEVVDTEPAISARICEAIEEVSFKGAGTETPVRSREAAVVQDADRLDAIGAVGIARTFAYGGHKNRLLYDPAIAPVVHQDFEQYKGSTAPTINHFYEKLLLLKDRMNTEAAAKMAMERHLFMEHFLNQFFREWAAEA